MICLKSFFMNEIYDLRQEISSAWSQLKQDSFDQSRNNDCVEEDEITNEELKAKLHSYQNENQLLKEEIKTIRKQ